jgi:hypothetical protein
VSAILLFFMTIAPFGVGVSWSGHELVVTNATALSEKGAVVGKTGTLVGQVELFTVTEVFREGGELTYRAVPTTGGETVSIPAREARQSLLASVPALGFWARTLSHPIGVLALIGIPLLTFALDVVLVAWMGGARTRVRGVMHAYRVRSASRKERKARALEEERALEQEEFKHEERLATQVAYREEASQRPARNTPETYGMTIKLARPQRYGMNLQ